METVEDVSKMATPLGLILLGASFAFSDVKKVSTRNHIYRYYKVNRSSFNYDST